jgi:hypothetical protein
MSFLVRQICEQTLKLVYQLKTNAVNWYYQKMIIAIRCTAGAKAKGNELEAFIIVERSLLCFFPLGVDHKTIFADHVKAWEENGWVFPNMNRPFFGKKPFHLFTAAE